MPRKRAHPRDRRPPALRLDALTERELVRLAHLRVLYDDAGRVLYRASKAQAREAWHRLRALREGRADG